MVLQHLRRKGDMAVNGNELHFNLFSFSKKKGLSVGDERSGSRRLSRFLLGGRAAFNRFLFCVFFWKSGDDLA